MNDLPILLRLCRRLCGRADAGLRADMRHQARSSGHRAIKRCRAHSNRTGERGGEALSVNSSFAAEPLEALLIRFEYTGGGTLQVLQGVLNPALQLGVWLLRTHFECAGVENFQILQCVFDSALQRDLGSLLSGPRLFVSRASRGSATRMCRGTKADEQFEFGKRKSPAVRPGLLRFMPISQQNTQAA